MVRQRCDTLHELATQLTKTERFSNNARTKVKEIKMTNLYVYSEITFDEIEDIRLITSNNYQTYNFVNASIAIKINVDDEAYEATLQNGQSYHLSDYSLPSNLLSVYEGSELLEQLNQLMEDDFEDKNQIDYINEVCETSYTKEQLLAIYSELNEIIGEAQQIVNDAEREADEELENNSKTYVVITHQEWIDEEDHSYGKRVCDYDETKSFDKKEQAQAFVEQKNDELTWARIVDKEIGIVNIQSQH